MDILKWINDYAPSLTILGSLIYAAWSFNRYLRLRGEALSSEQFRTYHGLIRDLVQPGSGEVMRRDRQIAVVFELRHFPAYFEVTSRILAGLRSDWKDADLRLLQEIELAIEYVDARRTSRFRRRQIAPGESASPPREVVDGGRSGTTT